jgi:hypothetical protein
MTLDPMTVSLLTVLVLTPLAAFLVWLASESTAPAPVRVRTDDEQRARDGLRDRRGDDGPGCSLDHHGA